MISSWRLIAIALALVLGCAHTPKTSSKPGTGVIAGMVTDEHGRPLKHCGVTATPRYSDYIRLGFKTFSAPTSAEGKYTVLNVPVGTYRVRGTASGFDAQYRDSVQVREDVASIVDFKLKAQHLDPRDVKGEP